jgi:hypothetical protein
VWKHRLSCVKIYIYIHAQISFQCRDRETWVLFLGKSSTTAQTRIFFPNLAATWTRRGGRSAALIPRDPCTKSSTNKDKFFPCINSFHTWAPRQRTRVLLRKEYQGKPSKKLVYKYALFSCKKGG